ncbi:fatty acid--CoA ligase family protein [Polynucleobacter sp. AP-Nickl1-40-C4]|uniref:ANL family adenylate-forming protein n=1 Tax=Polynucleobacter sp. AP-Nickl1-40-C4 TaxID=3108275 RepID=UPI002B23602E|nr:fatty acid--CoA ligase family protein [Polynucleobacter sp. AP-Nickl1-40-C4]MEA9568024.1 fatty acid--CoA ligase family protein [Polynucleobacter sp. AP-Nickl1-40-C4]
MSNSTNWLYERFQGSPDKLAFIHENREVTYGQVTNLIRNFYDQIILSGIAPGELVVVIGDYSPEIFCIFLALAKNKNIIIPITKNSVVEEDSALEVSGCDWRINFNSLDASIQIDVYKVVKQNILVEELRGTNVPGLILFSSGSTGKPKAILHDFNRVMDKFRTQRPPISAIPFLMIDHFGGINTILAITSGLGTVVTVSDRSASKICEAIEKFKVELLPATPSFLNLLLASKMYEKYDLSSLKRITYGTEVMPQSTLDRINRIFSRVKLLQTYGLSEVGVLHSKSKGDGSTWVKVGGEGFQTKVIDGILWIKSAYAMVGYLNAPSDFDDEGWFNTHDQVEVDGEFFRILGRKTEIINTGGQKVYPVEIESVILELENIEDVAVYGEKHALLGQMIVAKILLKAPESSESVKKRVRSACLSCLAPFKAPSKVILTKDPLHNSRQKKIRR